MFSSFATHPLTLTSHAVGSQILILTGSAGHSEWDAVLHRPYHRFHARFGVQPSRGLCEVRAVRLRVGHAACQVQALPSGDGEVQGIDAVIKR